MTEIMTGLAPRSTFALAAPIMLAAMVAAASAHPAWAQTTKPLSSAAASTPALPGAAPIPHVSTTTGDADDPNAAYAAFQRGFYLTAFGLATHRAEDKADPKAMALLGELYAGGLGVPQNDVKAAEWYKLAADRGDREAMFALGMFRLKGRGGPRDREASAKWLAAAAKLGHPLAAYDLALLYIEGQLFPQDFARAAELLRIAATAGNPDAQYALGTLYKQGRGVTKDMKEAVRLWALASIADNTDAEVEYAIALFNGDGVAKNEQAAAVLFRKAALRGNAIGQDRLARILADGRGAPKDPVEAAKWHMISKAHGETDLMLDDFVANLDAPTRAAAEKAAKPYLDAIKRPPG